MKYIRKIFKKIKKIKEECELFHDYYTKVFCFSSNLSKVLFDFFNLEDYRIVLRDNALDIYVNRVRYPVISILKEENKLTLFLLSCARRRKFLVLDLFEVTQDDVLFDIYNILKLYLLFKVKDYISEKVEAKYRLIIDNIVAYESNLRKITDIVIKDLRTNQMFVVGQEIVTTDKTLCYLNLKNIDISQIIQMLNAKRF